MARLIIVALVAAEQLQDRDAHGRKQAVGADNDQKDRHKIKAERLHRAFDGHCDPVARAEAAHAEQRQQPARFRLAFGGAAAVHQLDRTELCHAAKIHQQRQQQNRAEEDRRQRHGSRRELERKLNIHAAHQLRHEHGHELLQKRTQRNAAHNADQRHIQRLKAKHGGDVPLAHAEHIVKAQLLAAPLHQEAVCIEQENNRKQAHHDQTDAHIDRQIIIPRLRGCRLCVGQRRQNVERRRRAEHGQDVRQIELPVLVQILRRKLRIKQLIHGLLPRFAGLSACRRSCRTWPRGSFLRDRAGGTPRRP